MTDQVDPKEPTDASPPEAESEAPSTAESEAAPPEASAAPDAEHESSDEGGEAEASGEAAAEGEAAPEGEAAAEGEGGKKKRRRRRRKKKKGEHPEGEAVVEGAESAPQERAHRHHKDPSQLPFQRFFDGGPRRHAFSVGEIVAGRVLETRDEIAVVDLFGKAIAFTRLHEPRDIPVGPAHPVEEHEEPAEHEAEAVAPEGAEAGIEAVGTETPAEPVEAPADVHAEAPASEEAALEAHADEHHEEHAEEPEEGAPMPELPAYVVHPENVPPINAGEIFRGRVGAVAESGHIALVNELVDVKATRAVLKRAKEDRSRVVGLVFGFNRGGFDVLIYGLRAFCPVSGMVIEMIDDPTPLLGQWAEFHVQAAKSGIQGLVVSRRSILEKEARKRAKILLKSLEPGQVVKGRVTQVRDYGLFVDIGGLEGLVHQSELSWERGVRPEDVAKAGDEIEVQVIKVHERESKRERYDRVSLSLKALAADPWQEKVEQLHEGIPQKGTIVRTAEFGAFVQLAPGIDGLLHITELGKDLKHADQAVKEGDEIYVVIERIDRKQRRISLSKLSNDEVALFEKGELVSGEGTPVRLKPGAHIKVRVTQVGPAGLQVQVDSVVGRRGRGFIPNSEMGTPRGTDHRRQWPPGTEIDVKIIGTDRDGGLRCSRKGFLIDEERRAVKEYRKEVSKQGLGTFGDILRQKLGIDQESR